VDLLASEQQFGGHNSSFLLALKCPGHDVVYMLVLVESSGETLVFLGIS
jgi:hypothetical protein